MEQSRLRELEALCIQEEPPQCKAACPLNVDGRGLAAAVEDKRWDQAWKVLRTTMPFPGVLGRLCHGPCMSACTRKLAGDSIRLHDLERAVVSHPAPTQRILPLPGRSKRAVVAGDGLAGLTVAWDLARKGYPVEILTASATPGADLYREYPALPQGSIEAETAILERLGVTVTTNVSFDEPGFMKKITASCDTLFLSLDAFPGPDPFSSLGLARESGTIRIHPVTRAASLEHVYVGGGARFPVDRAAEGRAAATSMDRHMQGVSLTSQRVNEGVYETRLFVSLEGVGPLPEVVPTNPAKGYSEDEAVREAERCLGCECRVCVRECAYLEAYKGYPKTYVRQIYNNESIVKGSRLANKLINSCMLCGQCSVLCPNDFPMAELCLDTRRSMVRRKVMPPSAHDFALEDMKFNTGEHFALSRHAPGRDGSAYLFFPGCQLSGSSPEQVKNTYAWLRSEISPDTGLMLGCCGAPALWAGQEELFARTLDGLRTMARDMGSPPLVPACATCASVLSEHAPDLELISLWEVMDKHGLKAAPSASAPATPLTLHDPCTARHNPEMRGAVRNILDKGGVKVEEFRLQGEATACCGYGGLVYNANPGLAREAAKRRTLETDNDILAYCAMCRDNLAATGKRVLHLLDLVFPPKTDPADRPNPGFSARHENRARLRRDLLRSLWNEEPEDMEAHESVTLDLSPEIRARCEERMILEDDIRKVVFHAEKTGRKLHDPETGRFLASFRPVRVTYWVEYEPRDNGPAPCYVVHNAYSHRMSLPGDEK